jgi:hypothetical protein
MGWSGCADNIQTYGAHFLPAVSLLTESPHAGGCLETCERGSSSMPSIARAGPSVGQITAPEWDGS